MTSDSSDNASKLDRLYDRASAILDGKANGLSMPILRHLTSRRHHWAMVEYANRLSYDGYLGRTLDPSSPAGIYRLAHRLGNPNAPQHLGMSAFNRGDLRTYRHWLRKAADAGDGNAAEELRRFEIRGPHSATRKIRRARMYRNYDYGIERANWRKRNLLTRLK